MKTPLIVAYCLVAVFFLVCLFSGNYEFLVYAAALVVLIVLIHKTDPVFDYESLALWSFVAWVIMHLAGGFLKVGDSVLYDLVLIPIVGEPYSVLKFDQFVHAFCYFFFSLLVYSVVEKVVAKNANKLAVSILVVLAAIGIGSINEIIEFTTTIFWDTGVGGYVNNSIDLVANLIGAVIGVWTYPKLKK
jgi:hypothetical protein